MRVGQNSSTAVRSSASHFPLSMTVRVAAGVSLEPRFYETGDEKTVTSSDLPDIASPSKGCGAGDE